MREEVFIPGTIEQFNTKMTQSEFMMIAKFMTLDGSKEDKTIF
jgi:hypothetical protein